MSCYVSCFPFLGCRGCWGLARLRYRLVKFLMFLEWNKKDLVLRYMFCLYCLHLSLLIGYSLLSTHRPTFSVSLRKMKTVFILKEVNNFFWSSLSH